MKDRLIVALDVETLEKAKALVDLLFPNVKIFKVGSQLFTACGPAAVKMIQQKGAEVFLDLKFFDIPNTVKNAVKAAVGLKVKMLTLHISGGEEMLKAAVKAKNEEARHLKLRPPLLIGVTVLTSQRTNPKAVLRLAKLGIDYGLDGVVSSAQEADVLRKNIKRKFLIVTPGIRLASEKKHDQKRVVTVKDAVKAGSDFLVIGRPILESKDPLLAAKRIIGELSWQKKSRI